MDILYQLATLQERKGLLHASPQSPRTGAESSNNSDATGNTCMPQSWGLQGIPLNAQLSCTETSCSPEPPQKVIAVPSTALRVMSWSDSIFSRSLRWANASNAGITISCLSLRRTSAIRSYVDGLDTPLLTTKSTSNSNTNCAAAHTSFAQRFWQAKQECPRFQGIPSCNSIVGAPARMPRTPMMCAQPAQAIQHTAVPTLNSDTL